MSEYITHQNSFSIARVAFDLPEYARVVAALRDAVETICGEIPEMSLDRITITLDYGVIKVKDAPTESGEGR
jgi:hypothetical protein